MKFINLGDTSRTANPSAEALQGYSIEKELRAAVRGAVKPISKKLRDYRSERARLEANVGRWNGAAYDAKLSEITARAHAGDEEAVAAIETGAIPSRQSYDEMHHRASLELEKCDQQSISLFREVLPLVGEPMNKAVDKGQQLLDDVLEGLDIPRFELSGWRNHVSYVLLQLEHATKNQSADLAWFWSAVE
jgi:hypothetical protein